MDPTHLQIKHMLRVRDLALEGGERGGRPGPRLQGAPPQAYMQYTVCIRLDSSIPIDSFRLPCSRAEPANRDSGVGVTF